MTIAVTPHAYSPAACPFCAAAAPHAGATATLGCPIWRCACRALGVGGQPMDIDEVLDELEATIGLARGTLGGAPTAPVGSSGMLHATYIDPDAMAKAAVASAPDGWRVGRSRATLVVQTAPAEPTRTYEQIVIWARRA